GELVDRSGEHAPERAGFDDRALVEAGELVALVGEAGEELEPVREGAQAAHRSEVALGGRLALGLGAVDEPADREPPGLGPAVPGGVETDRFGLAVAAGGEIRQRE